MNGKISTPIALGVIGFACLCVGIVGTLVYSGKDAGQFLTFVVMLIPSTIGLVIVSKQTQSVSDKTDAQTDKIDSIHDNVNGKLDAKFRALGDKISAVDNKIDLQSMQDVADPIEKDSLKPKPKARRAKP